MQPVLLCGYYGEHNLGDDALLEAMLDQLPSGLTPLVTAFDQDEVQRRHRVETVPRRSLPAVLAALGDCRALVLGGGSLLQDATSFRSLLYYAALISAARLQGKPVLLWAQGLGPLQRRRSRALVRGLLPLVSGITWRDAASAQLGRELGVQARHGTDAVWSLPRQNWLGVGGPMVVCWRPTPHLQGAAWKPYLTALEQLADKSDREVIWLPFHRDQDTPLLEQLTAQEQKLTLASQQLQTKVESFRTQKETIKATYSAAEAQVRINEAFTGISSELGDVGLAIQRAEDRTAQMQARAGAMEELMATGALDVPGGKDSLTAELERLSADSQVESELAQMRAQLDGSAAPAAVTGAADASTSVAPPPTPSAEVVEAEIAEEAPAPPATPTEQPPAGPVTP